MLYQLNTAALATRVRAKRAGRPLRALVKEIGNISPATLSRVENQGTPKLPVLLLLCNWLEMSPAVVLHDLHHAPDTSAEYQATAADLTALELFIGVTPTVAFQSPSPEELLSAFHEARTQAEDQIAALFAIETF